MKNLIYLKNLTYIIQVKKLNLIISQKRGKANGNKKKRCKQTPNCFCMEHYTFKDLDTLSIIGEREGTR